ncbi:MAG: TIGR02221 family CRISPR-associated protein [Treponema sp.]|nr:TIGR02221 family CRISPR-associated protein [Treponema sp.]
MAKVLIASIGSGNPKAERHAYRPAVYYSADIPNENFYETPLVAAALKKMYGIDEVIFVGTSGSSWGPLYDYIYSDNNIDNNYFPISGISGEYDLEYNIKLEENFNKSSAIKTRLSVDQTKKDLVKLKETMGDFCRDIVVLEYGATPEEQLKNLTILNKLAEMLKDGDIVYFDISHAFRSLPFYELLTINLAKSILQRSISIEMVSYAMLEASSLYGGKTPVVDMTQLIELLDWTRAVDEYNRNGRFDLLLKLYKSDNKIGQHIKNQMSRQASIAFNKLVETMSSDNNAGDFKGMVDSPVAALENPNKVLEHPTLIYLILLAIPYAAHWDNLCMIIFAMRTAEFLKSKTACPFQTRLLFRRHYALSSVY